MSRGLGSWLEPWRDAGRAAWICGGVAVLAYLNTLGNGFAYDDLHIILENGRIDGWHRFWEALTTPYWPIEEGEALGLWRPLASGVYFVLWNTFGGSPLPYHILNVVMHGLVTASVTLLAARLIPVAGAFAGGLLFAVHPVHTEVVANGIGFAELVGALAMVVACLMFLRWREEGFDAKRSAAIAAVFGVGFLTKESAITLPGVLFLLDGYFEDLELRDLGAYIRRRWLVYGSIVAAAALVFLGRFAILGSVADPLPPLGAELLLEIPRIWTLAEIWTHYGRLLFFPFDLSVEYSPQVIGIHIGWNWINTVGAIFAIGFLLLALTCWRHKTETGLAPRAIGAGIMWCVITISPVTNFFVLTGTLLGERLLYTPSIGLSIGAGWALWAIHRSRPRLHRWAVLTFAGILVAFTAKTIDRNPTWKDTETVFLTMIDTHLEAGRAQWVVGDTFWEKNQVSAALRSYRYAIGSVGAGYSLISEITKKLLGIERYESAEVLARMLWDDEPSWDAGPGLLAVALVGQERYEEAAIAAEIAKEMDPDDTVTRHLLSDAYSRLGRYDRAAVERRAAIHYGEGDKWQQWMWLAEVEAARGDTLAAVAAADSARTRAESVEAHARLDTLNITLGVHTPDSPRETQR